MTDASRKTAIVHLDKAGVTYSGGTVALRPTSLTFYTGETVVLLGLSGAGKSTLLRTLNHLVRPTIGRIVSVEFGDLSAGRQLRRHRRQTAMVFQQHQLIERHSALDNVLTGRLSYHSAWRSLMPLPRSDIEFALHCLDRVGLADKALVRADQLSGGQQQRVGIARALAQQPRLILADEPVASLDPATADKVLSLLERICREDSIGAVISLHQLEYARRFADRIVGLADAQVVFDSSPRDLDDEQLQRIYRTHHIRENQTPTPRLAYA